MFGPCDGVRGVRIGRWIGSSHYLFVLIFQIEMANVVISCMAARLLLSACGVCVIQGWFGLVVVVGRVAFYLGSGGRG